MDKTKHYKNRLEISEIRFEAIARTATDSIVISDEDSVIVFANKKTYEIFGYEKGELLGANIGILMPESYRKGHEAGVNRYVSSGIPKLIGHTIEIEGLRKDGTVFPIELSLSSWQEEGKHFFCGIIRDITKRKIAYKEREEVNRKLQEKQNRLEAANEELQAFHEELTAANEELQASQEELKAANNELLKKEVLLTNWNNDLEEKVKERTLQIEQQKEWLHNLIMQVPALIGLLSGREGKITLCNPFLRKLWGDRDIEGKTVREAFPELEGQGYFELLESVFDTGEPVARSEFPAMIDRHNNGELEEAFFNFIYAPYYDTKGEIEGVIAYGEDATKQVLARQVVEKSASRFHFMADAMPQKVWTANADGNVDYFNKKWLEYAGLTFEELKDWGWKDIIHPDDWEENERVWLRSIQTGDDFQLEHRFKRKDGQYRWHLSRGLAHRNEHGEISMWVGTNTDIHDQRLAQEKLLKTKAELRKSNEELKKKNNDLDNFIYTASHDLKSPISNLEGLINLLKPNLNKKVSDKESLMLEMMEKSIFRLRKTISDLTEITKAQKGEGEPPEEVFFAEILEDVKSDLANEIKSSAVHLQEEIEVPKIIYSRNNLRSIIFNLISNAIKYRSPDRPLVVKIHSYKEKEIVCLEVSDNGVGLSEQQLPKLFTMFKRLHTHVEGTGIGLYILKRIVENNGGSIEVASELDKGTSFKVLFRQREK